jgi:trans-aconitate 2-methyltransferase
MWDPVQYGVFGDERARPFGELLARVRAVQPARVVDLGCGDGGLTATLLDRWPAARVQGVDSSAEMLAGAADHAVPGRLSFVLGSIEEWRPQHPVDVLVSNAALHWVRGHPALLGRLVAALAPAGWLAVQVPANFDSPTHTELAAVCQSPRWRDRLGAVSRRNPPVLAPSAYLDLLAGSRCAVDVWETTYLHVLGGADPVLDWVRGTALRPVLAALADDPAAEAQFLAEYGERLRRAYPPRPHGTILPFRRIFAVAQKLP